MTKETGTNGAMPQVTILDTAASSRNLGDQIIMDAVRRELRKTAPEAFYVTVPTHDFIGEEGRKLVEESAASVIGGTNLLSSQINKYNQWKVKWADTRWLRDVILLGVGWWQYQDAPNWLTRQFYKRTLSADFPHSLRDGYTADRMKSIGFSNALNTCCVTLWELDEAKQATIPTSRAGSVVATLTDYKPAPDEDRALLELLKRKYDKVYLWLQGARDFSYISELHVDGIELLEPNLAAYDELLSSSENLEYVGTRLHAGVRALSRGRRTTILAVDNRAEEIGKDVRLPVIARTDGVDVLERRIDQEGPLSLNLPWESIAHWRGSLRRHIDLPAQSATSAVGVG